MTQCVNYQILSNQGDQPYKNLEKVIAKHAQHAFQRNIPDLQQEIFESVDKIVRHENKPMILDGGCGRGMSTEVLAQQYPDHLIIGLDKSIHRLSQNAHWHSNNTNTSSFIQQHENLLFVQADLFDFVLLAHQAHWQFAKQCYFYPNPWPKSHHFKRRLHGHPAFPLLLDLSPIIEIRSNWRIYCEEWIQATELLKPNAKTELITLNNIDRPISHFEQKYVQTKETLYQMLIEQL